MIAATTNYDKIVTVLVFLFLMRSLLQNFRLSATDVSKSSSHGPRNVIHHWCCGGGESVHGNFSFQRGAVTKAVSEFIAPTPSP